MDRTNPLDKHVQLMAEITEMNEAPMTAQMFGNAGIEHMKRYGTKPEHFAKIAYKNHKHSVNNPYVSPSLSFCLFSSQNSGIRNSAKSIHWTKSRARLKSLVP